MAEDSGKTSVDTFFNYTGFRNESREGYPVTFGVAEPLYHRLLEQSAIKERLTDFPQKVFLLGCGSIESLQEFLRFARNLNPNSEVIISDLSDKLLDIIKRQASLIPKSKRGNLKFIQTDARELGIQDNSVDAVFTNLLLLNIGGSGAGYYKRTDQIDKLLRETHRIIKPGGGVFLVESPAFWSKPNNNWQDRYKESNTVACDFLRRAGFDLAQSFVGPIISKDEYLKKHHISPTRIMNANFVRQSNWGGQYGGIDLVASFGLK